ncbi:hypothetical protein BDZ89DRAFT_1117914 [Hymenopellis radicata]|nr:hypothetical protein BDZ89DRAFT_1117914 [Hymenopellis radicata]
MTDGTRIPNEEEERPRRASYSPLKRTILFIFVGLAFAIVYSRLKAKSLERQNKIVYAKRYSDAFKFRPAASPIITETLKGGGTKLRGALPTPTPTPEKKKRKRTRRSSKTNTKKAKNNK